MTLHNTTGYLVRENINPLMKLKLNCSGSTHSTVNGVKRALLANCEAWKACHHRGENDFPSLSRASYMTMSASYSSLEVGWYSRTMIHCPLKQGHHRKTSKEIRKILQSPCLNPMERLWNDLKSHSYQTCSWWSPTFTDSTVNVAWVCLIKTWKLLITVCVFLAEAHSVCLYLHYN